MVFSAFSTVQVSDLVGKVDRGSVMKCWHVDATAGLCRCNLNTSYRSCPVYYHHRYCYDPHLVVTLDTFACIFLCNTCIDDGWMVGEKGRDLTRSTDRKIQNATWQHKNATKNFDYTTIADRLRTVSWGNESLPTCEVKQVYGIPTFPLTAKAL